MAERHPPGSMVVVRVSPEAHELISDLKDATLRIAQASPLDRDEVNDAYAAYVMRQKELYEYVQNLERSQRVVASPVTLRF